MPLLQSEPVLALGYDQLNSGDVGTEAGHVTRKECQAFRGRVSADVKVWQRRPSLAAASEGWEGWKDGRMEGWKDGRMEGWKEQPHRDHPCPPCEFFSCCPRRGQNFNSAAVIRTNFRNAMVSHGGHGRWIDPLMRRLRRSFRAWPRGWRIPGSWGFRFASPQAILKRSFAAEGAGTNALEKRTRDRSKLEGMTCLRRSFRAWLRGWRIPGVPLCFTPGYLEAQLRC